MREEKKASMSESKDTDNLPAIIPPVVPLSNRQKDGKFSKGNKIAKGNPFMKDVAKLRSFLFNEISKGHWEQVKQSLIKGAIDGDSKMMTLLLQYAVGKPTESIDINMTATQITPDEQKQRIREMFQLK